jgi:hypothetical protein
MSQADGGKPNRPSRTYESAIGQIAEWLVWTHLVAASSGDLQVFLPLKDQGVDGIVHRISTDSFARLQVKGRHRHRGALWVVVSADEVIDDRAWIVAVEVNQSLTALGETAMLVEAPTFRDRASRSMEGTPRYEAIVTLPPRPGERWTPWCVSLNSIADRLLPAATASVGELVVSAADQADWEKTGNLGYRAEMELLRRSADCARLNLFKAFPDLEPDEYVVYDLQSRGILGIQVKAVTLGIRGEATLNVYRPALRPSVRTWFVIFMAEGNANALDDHCAVVPSHFVADRLSGHGPHGRLSVSRGFTGRLDQWRVPLVALGSRLAELAASVA